MNDTLKGVAHIGAELAAAKADLQREMERHRKTWRQLEQVNNAMRRIVERCEIFIDDEAEMSTASVEALMGIAEDALSLQAEPQGKFRMGDLVRKTTGSEWEGRVVGWYSTEQTAEGYAVESSAHRNSVQIYPAKVLELVPNNE